MDDQEIKNGQQAKATAPSGDDLKVENNKVLVEIALDEGRKRNLLLDSDVVRGKFERILQEGQMISLLQSLDIFQLPALG